MNVEWNSFCEYVLFFHSNYSWAQKLSMPGYILLPYKIEQVQPRFSWIDCIGPNSMHSHVMLNW